MGEIKEETYRCYPAGKNLVGQWTKIGSAAENYEEVAQLGKSEGGATPVTTQGLHVAVKEDIDAWSVLSPATAGSPVGVEPIGAGKLVYPNKTAKFLKITACSIHSYGESLKEKDYQLIAEMGSGGPKPKSENATKKAKEWVHAALTKAEAEAITEAQATSNFSLEIKALLASENDVYCAYIEVTIEWEEAQDKQALII